MAKENTDLTLDPEIAAISAVVAALRELDAATQQNVIDYVVRRFKLRRISFDESDEGAPGRRTAEPEGPEHGTRDHTPSGSADDGLEGVSPVARKWMARSNFTTEALSRLFSLGIEEIDVVAKKVPGKSKKERMRSVILLKGIAAYLGSGAARMSHEQVKETCLHYDAYDTDNFASYLKSFAAEVSGTKEGGYTLSARGLTAATELVRELLNGGSK